MGANPDINRVIDFYKLLSDFGRIKRVIRIPPEVKIQENDVEHSYNMAMVAWFLAGHFPNIDNNKVIKIALVHDLVEVHAGDTFAFASEKEKQAKQKREEKAYKQLCKEWKDFPEMLALIKEYENRESEEAKFIYALDKLLPSIMNYLGGGYTWKEHGISFDKYIEEKNNKISLSPEIEYYFKQLVKVLEKNLDLFPKVK